MYITLLMSYGFGLAILTMIFVIPNVTAFTSCAQECNSKQIILQTVLIAIGAITFLMSLVFVVTVQCLVRHDCSNAYEC